MRDYEPAPGATRVRRNPDVQATVDASHAGAGHAHGRPSGAHDAASLLHLQRTVGNAGVVQLLGEDQADDTSPVLDVVGKGGGSSLDAGTRSSMESSFGADFSDVRVHTDSKASSSAESVGANAYTVGSDIVFKSGQYSPGSATGQRTLAHELTHVVQQRSGPVDGSDAPGGIRLSDPSDKFERAADDTASSIVSGQAATPAAPAAAAGTTAQLEADETSPLAPVQREVPEEEEIAL